MTSKTTNKFSPEVREPRGPDGAGSRARASVALGGDRVDRGEDRLHGADAERVGEEGRGRQRQACRRDDGRWRAKLKALERENRELRQANEILRKASRVFCPGGARPPVQAMIAFIDDHREAHGVEPICKVLPIAPSTYHDHAAKRADPGQLSARAKRDAGAEARDRARLRRELRGLRRAQGLAADAARRASRSPAALWRG